LIAGQSAARIGPCEDAEMLKSVVIHDLDEQTYRSLTARAAEAGLSVPDFLRREVLRIARMPRVTEWLARTECRSGSTRESDVIEGLDEFRGEWPAAASR
jgi:plasmid stability protein